MKAITQEKQDKEAFRPQDDPPTTSNTSFNRKAPRKSSSPPQSSLSLGSSSTTNNFVLVEEGPPTVFNSIISAFSALKNKLFSTDPSSNNLLKPSEWMLSGGDVSIDRISYIFGSECRIGIMQMMPQKMKEFENQFLDGLRQTLDNIDTDPDSLAASTKKLEAAFSKREAVLAYTVKQKSIILLALGQKMVPRLPGKINLSPKHLEILDRIRSDFNPNEFQTVQIAWQEYCRDVETLQNKPESAKHINKTWNELKIESSEEFPITDSFSGVPKPGSATMYFLDLICITFKCALQCLGIFSPVLRGRMIIEQFPHSLDPAQIIEYIIRKERPFP